MAVQKLGMTAQEKELRYIQACREELAKRTDYRVAAEQSLSEFLRGAWPYIDPNPYQDGWHLDAVAEHLEAVTRGKIKRLIINIPPRMSKSSLVSIAWPAWTWAQSPPPPPPPPAGTKPPVDPLSLQFPDTGPKFLKNFSHPLSGPHTQFLFASYAQSLALRDSTKTRRLLESPWYQKYWGNRFHLVDDQNTKVRFENSKGGYRLATSVGGSLTGEGGACIVIDDPENATEITSDAMREQVALWWDEAMSTRLNDPKEGAYVIIMQRLAENDLTGHILSKDNGEYVHLCLPMEYEANRHCATKIGFSDPRTQEGELLCPERFGPNEVEEFQRNLGPYGYAGQMQQFPTPRGGGIIKREWWQVWPKWEEETDEDGQPLRPLEYPPMDYIVASLDPAYTEKQENDFSALTIWGVWRDERDLPKLMLMRAWQERLELNALLQKVHKSCINKNMKVDMLLIEAKASGHSVAQELRRLFGSEQRYGVQLMEPKGDKVARAYAIQHLFAEGVIFAPNRTWADEVITQAEHFPKGKHDDLVDSATQAIKFLRDTGWALRRDERDRDLQASMVYTGKKGVPLYDV